ncbi:hypothetical protein B0H13DRAFT_2305326 [Mycena leptocephala]|nr:hypothetical protein B0H13DRAFT_2305326 [Mycena leptocephala]
MSCPAYTDSIVVFAAFYLFALATDIAFKPRKGWDVELVKNLLECRTATVSPNKHPPGKKEPYGNLLFHPPGLPWADHTLNKIQNRVLFIPNILISPAYGINVLRRFTFKEAPALDSSTARAYNVSRGQGAEGNRGRGRGLAPRTTVSGTHAGPSTPAAFAPAPHSFQYTTNAPQQHVSAASTAWHSAP